MKRNLIIMTLILATTFNTVLAQTLKDEWVVCNPEGCKLLDPYYSDGVTMKWEGSCLDGKAHGFGKLTKFKEDEYESTYEGEFRNGIREGKGTFTHKDGSIAKGVFNNGQLMGYGTRTGEDGSRYEGEFVNYRQHGKGIITMANGSKFEGFFVADRMYTGKFTNYDGKITYIQEYKPIEKITEKRSGYKPQIGVRVTEYFDENWDRSSQKDAAYYRLVKYEADNKPKGIVKDYYIAGQLQSEYTVVYLDYDDEGKNFHEGEATWYYPNGNIEQKRYYYNNNVNGENTFYYENGQKEKEVSYFHGRLHGDYKLWYKTGKIKLYATYERGALLENKFIEFDENGVGALVYHEKFNLNKDNWEDQISGSLSKITEDNSVVVNVTKDEMTSRYNYITLDQESDYSIESIIQKKSGKGNEGYGIIFGFKDWDNYFSFFLSEIGSYTILMQFEGVNINIADWTKSDAINTGLKRNQLKVMKIDDEFIFLINGVIVERKEAKSLRGNNFGIVMYSKGEYVLENIIVKEFLAADELMRKVQKEESGANSEWNGNGSGIFINEKGYIATNYHVVKDANEIQVEYLQKGKKYTYAAKVIVTDKQNDLAIVQIQDPGFKSLPKIPYVFSTRIKDVGSEVFALGYPMENIMGSEIKFTDGKISSKTGIEGDITVYQISVPIQPGNSGGPLFDNEGNLVGITSGRLSKEQFNAENVNYAIKINYLKNLIDIMTEQIELPNNIDIYKKPLTEKIKLLTDFVPILRVK
jgi:S1-C subfamily serine protease/antitoxin component YwqK of YwqJK toxin-antitoxin module